MVGAGRRLNSSSLTKLKSTDRLFTHALRLSNQSKKACRHFQTCASSITKLGNSSSHSFRRVWLQYAMSKAFKSLVNKYCESDIIRQCMQHWRNNGTEKRSKKWTGDDQSVFAGCFWSDRWVFFQTLPIQTIVRVSSQIRVISISERRLQAILSQHADPSAYRSYPNRNTEEQQQVGRSNPKSLALCVDLT